LTDPVAPRPRRVCEGEFPFSKVFCPTFDKPVLGVIIGVARERPAG